MSFSYFLSLDCVNMHEDNPFLSSLCIEKPCQKVYWQRRRYYVEFVGIVACYPSCKGAFRLLIFLFPFRFFLSLLKIGVTTIPDHTLQQKTTTGTWLFPHVAQTYMVWFIFLSDFLLISHCTNTSKQVYMHLHADRQGIFFANILYLCFSFLLCCMHICGFCKWHN